MRITQSCLFSFSTSLFFLSFILFGCRSEQWASIDLEEAKKEIAAQNEIYFHSLAKGDSLLFASSYTEDCWIMPPNAPALCGAEAPFDFFNIAYVKQGIRNGKFIRIDLFGDDGKFLTEVGFWRTVDINNEFDNGKFIVIWKKTPQGWKRFRDMFSSDDK